MPGLKNTFIQTFSKAGGLFPLSFLLRLTGQKVILPLYHVVSDEPLAHIRHLYPVKSVAAFRADLDYLLKYLEPIDLLVLQDHVSGKKRLEKPGFLLTFDDGLREFHDVVAPILQEKGIPAVCFLNNGFLDNDGLFFRYKASLLVEALGNGGHELALGGWLKGQGMPADLGKAGVLRLQ